MAASPIWDEPVQAVTSLAMALWQQPQTVLFANPDGTLTCIRVKKLQEEQR